jgi:hypothetical protein
MSDTLELESLLREKDELIDALTERLELTAEQLDRLQRATGDRGHWMMGGVPVELVEQQQSLCEDLERVLVQWEEAQPGAALSRIERQLQELRDLVAQASLQAPREATRAIPPRHASPQDEPVQTEVPQESALAGWEALKAGLLAEAGIESASESSPPSDKNSAYSDRSAPPDPFAGEPLSPPSPLNVDAASIDELRDAVLARDEFIATVLERLRIAETQTRPSENWKALESVPEELRRRLESLERRLEEAHRISEVELSLERARLGREAARLKQLEETTAKAMERLGLAMSDQHRDRDEEPEDEPAETSPDGRWLRMLGIKRDR